MACSKVQIFKCLPLPYQRLAASNKADIEERKINYRRVVTLLSPMPLKRIVCRLMKKQHYSTENQAHVFDSALTDLKLNKRPYMQPKVVQCGKSGRSTSSHML